MGKNKILLIGFFASLAFLIPSLFQDAFAQSSAVFNIFETGNASDDECFVATRTAGTTWIGCFATSSTVLRINAMSGNSTIATTTVSAVQPVGGQEVFFALDATTIVYVDTSGANEVVRKYQLSGSTITNTQSLTLTGCASANSPPNAISNTLVYVCQDGGIRLINMNTMVLSATYTNVEQGNCTIVNGVVLLSTTKGMAWCDSTELYLFTVSGTTITHTDELTGLDSNAVKKGLISQGFAWLGPRDGTSEMQFAGVDTDTMTFTTTIQSLPTQATIVHFDVAGVYLLTLDSTDDNILVYDTRLEQPSVALANFSVPLSEITDRAYIISVDGGATFAITTSVANTGRYYLMTDVIIEGDPIDEPPPVNDPFDTGIDCSLPANEHKLICNIPGGGGIETNLGNATGTGLLLLGCTVVFVVCEDTNPQTNGIGLLAFIASLFVIVGMFYYVLGTDRVANIPLFIWIIIVIALSAFFTLAGWIDPVFLIISIVAVIALAAPRLISVIRGGGGNTMGGGSTE